jgi:hypothetical protein
MPRGSGDIWATYGGEIALHRTIENGAPRPMKMGTIVSRFPYDAAAYNAFQLASLRCPPIQDYASRIPASQDSLGGHPLQPQIDEGPVAEVGCYPFASSSPYKLQGFLGSRLGIVSADPCIF